MVSNHVIGVLLALASAFVWGSGDFGGGLATRRANQFQVLALAAFSGIGLLVALALARGEAMPSPMSALWAGSAGLAGALGLAGLYQALSLGQAANVAPTAAVVSVTLPVLYGAVTEGWPGAVRVVGFALAVAGIWLVSKTSGESDHVARRAFGLALLAGVGFGGFFILIALVEPGLVFTPLIVARSATLGLAVVLLVLRRVPLPSLGTSPTALAAGVLDAGGNILYLLAKQFTRLDVAVVLASLYPVSTVLLAWLLLKQKVAGWQWLGAGLCLLAIVLISLP
jgi:drug/metabolite transporter (DMT)-like permease